MEKDCPIRFLAEWPLGRLAKWLRLMGFDTLHGPDVPKPVSKDLLEGRIRLTRSRHLYTPTSTQYTIFIRSDHLEEQLRQMIQELRLTHEDAHPFSRCIRCNDILYKVNKNEIVWRVPDHIWETQETFSACRSCQRVYWSGTHTQRAGRIIEELINNVPRAD